ncbi:hypothetical protein DVH24_001389 [Malus domestica]|uniref:Uncharacterized protein n=1 Tax=Malus domestica TaxID=3750 RepID=A0A498K595_MALDO|nr:hypothetical protein DVH24_001389 [Malus domestica]
MQNSVLIWKMKLEIITQMAEKKKFECEVSLTGKWLLKQGCLAVEEIHGFWNMGCFESVVSLPLQCSSKGSCDAESEASNFFVIELDSPRVSPPP